MNCTLFGCTCQGFADYYGAVAGSGWGCAPQPAGKAWWSRHGCDVKSKAGCKTASNLPQLLTASNLQFLISGTFMRDCCVLSVCNGPACKLPGHAACDPPGAGPGPSGGVGVWNASQDLQAATINVSALAKSGLKITTSSFIAEGSNVMISSLTVSEDTALSFTLMFAVGDEGHATRASVHGGTPAVAGETAFRDRNFASVMPCSASDIIGEYR